MTITEKNFIPMLFLASGSFAASGDATVIVQQFAPYSTSFSNYLNITATGASVTTATNSADTRYEIYLTSTSSSAGGGKNKGSSTTTSAYFAPHYLDDDIVSWFTPLSTDSSIGTADSNYYTGTAKLQFYSRTSSSSKNDPNPGQGSSTANSLFTQLKFDLDGVTTYGVAEVVYSDQAAPEWRSIRYEVPDAVAPVAEPAVWAEMIAGFGAIGAAMRRRRPAPRALAA